MKGPNRRMVQRDGQRFYDLLSFLAEIAVPLLEATLMNLRKDNHTPLGWKNGPNSITSNSMQLRTIVVPFILRSIDMLVEQINNNEHDTLYRTMFHRPLTTKDKAEISSWTLHVQDYFFYVKTRPKEGAVLVQCGAGTDSKIKNQLLKVNDDVHESQIFVVQGLMDPLSYVRRTHVEIHYS